MFVFHAFPYTNFHEINIDWILQKVKALEEWAEQFDIDELKTEIENIINEMVESGKFDELFEEWLQPIRDDITALKNRVTVVENLCVTLRTDLNALTLDYNTAKADIYSQLDDISADITTLETFKDSATDELADHENRITALENATPEPTKWQNKNYIYGGNVYSSLNALLSAIENGSALIGDYANTDLRIFSGDPTATRNFNVYVAKFVGEKRAFLVLSPTNWNYNRNSDDGVSYVGSQVKIAVESTAAMNGTALNLMQFHITNTGSYDSAVLACLLSAAQAAGIAPIPDSIYSTGKLPFIDIYLRNTNNAMLVDDDGTKFVVADFSTTAEGAILKYSTDNSGNYSIPFMVLCNME